MKTYIILQGYDDLGETVAGVEQSPWCADNKARQVHHMLHPSNNGYLAIEIWTPGDRTYDVRYTWREGVEIDFYGQVA